MRLSDLKQLDLDLLSTNYNDFYYGSSHSTQLFLDNKEIKFNTVFTGINYTGSEHLCFVLWPDISQTIDYDYCLFKIVSIYLESAEFTISPTISTMTLLYFINQCAISDLTVAEALQLI